MRNMLCEEWGAHKQVTFWGVLNHCIILKGLFFKTFFTAIIGQADGSRPALGSLVDNILPTWYIPLCCLDRIHSWGTPDFFGSLGL